MEAFKLILLLINLIVVFSQSLSQSYPEDCVNLYNFLKTPLDRNCCTSDPMVICDNENYITAFVIKGEFVDAQFNFFYFPPLGRIKVLRLTRCGMENIPETILGSSTLETLELTDNNIKVLPNNFFNRLPNLKELRLTRCGMENIPETILGSSTLETLELTDNNIKVLPNNFFNRLPNLKELNLNNNVDLNLSINRSSTLNSIEECYIINVNVNCYEPGSCKNLFITDGAEPITDAQAKLKYKSCIINTIPDVTNTTVVNTTPLTNESIYQNGNKKIPSSNTDSSSNYNSNANPNANSNSNPNNSIYIKVGITLAVIGLALITAVLFIKYKKTLNSKYRIKVKLIYPIPLGSEIGSAFALLGCPTVLSALTFLERLVLNLLNNICCLLQTTGMISFNRAADRNKNGDFE
ncbi:L domain-like protein [Anaeromyces robustus]|uniref:L domain-like protein n=1 Tax=Anaeromyces robustus TaxID=1754192 RepID=A0A1Y1WTQ9_9FUNG|nr:L domain-like protein [Anaeromyces robustus]|eukprot:ORX76626.1 L domain-like protein [Anaeromyces robustus]